MSLAISIARSIASLWPEITTWLGIIVVGDGAHFALGRRVRDALRQLDIGAEQRRHRAHADRNRRLHRLPAQLEQLARSSRDRTTRPRTTPNIRQGCDRRRTAPPSRSSTPPSRVSAREHRERIGHDRRLGILGQPKLLVRPLAHQPEQVLPQRLVDLARTRRAPRGSPRPAPRPCRPTGCPAREKGMRASLSFCVTVWNEARASRFDCRLPARDSAQYLPAIAAAN